MPTVQAALSVSDAIEKWGAYAGLASVVGLGVLALLYFAQAKEVKRLREWIAGAEEREADLTRRIVAQASRAAAAGRPIPPQTAAGAVKRPAAKPAPATAAAAAAVAKVADPPTGAHPAPAAAPAASAGTAAPPKPGEATVVSPAIPAKGEPVGAPNGQPPMAKPAEIPAKPVASGVPGVPATVPGAENGQDSGETGPIAPVRTTAPRPARANQPSATLPPRGGEPTTRRAAAGDGGSGRSTGRTVGIIVAGVLALAVVGFGATQLLGGGEDTPVPSDTVGETVKQPASGGQSKTTTTPKRTSTANAADPSSVNVAVLNGTTVTGLAAEIARQVEQAGYVRGTVTNSPDQTRSATIVAYRTEADKAAALKVAQQIGVGGDAVRPLEQNDAVTAGDQADVVVIVGADRTDLP